MAQRRNALGRGLGALIPPAPSSTTPADEPAGRIAAVEPSAAAAPATREVGGELPVDGLGPVRM